MTAKVVMIVQHLPPRFRGGTEVYTQWIAHALSELGVELTVISVADMQRVHGDPVEVVKACSGSIRLVELSIRRDIAADLDSHFDNLAIGMAVEHIIRSSGATVAHIQGGFRISAAALLAAKRSHVRTFVTLHDFYYICPRVTLWNSNGSVCGGDVTADSCAHCCSTPCSQCGEIMEDWMEGYSDDLIRGIERGKQIVWSALQQADVVLAPSAFLRQVYVGHGLDGDIVKVHRLGTPWISSKRSANARRDELNLAFLGHLLPHKGASVLLDSLEHIASARSSIKLSIYGMRPWDQAYISRLQAKCGRFSGITFYPEYEPPELPAILARTDAVVVPSLWYENSPLVILGSLAHGVPVVASSIGALPEFVIDGFNGILFECGNAKDLAQKIDRLHADEDLMRRLRTNADYPRSSAVEASELLSMYVS